MSQTLSEITGAEVVLKFENHQFTGSFKDRGALVKLLTLTPNQRSAGVIAMSAGNHAQAVAYHSERLGISAKDTGNGMDEDGVAGLSAAVHIEALRQYRVAVGCRTRKIVMQLQPQDLKVKVEPSRLAQVRDQGAIIEAASGLLDYWRRRDIAGLLLMPATRHNLVHLNEALQLKTRR